MKKIVRVDDLQVFAITAELGSFSAAARQLGITPALASGAVRRLELCLEVRLFVRSTRRLRLSSEGEQYLPHANAALGALRDGEAVLSEARSEIAGVIRLSLPSDAGRNLILPWLDEFQDQHPGIQLVLKLSDQLVDFFKDNVDASIRYGELEDSSLVALPLAATNRRAAYASPQYLARYGAPREPVDLKRHNCLLYVVGDYVHQRWSFTLGADEQTISVKGDRISDDADVVRRWAVAGKGVVYKSKLDVSEDVRAGRLIQLLPGYTGQSSPLHLVCAHRLSLTPSMQLLRAFLAERCEKALA